MVAAASSRLTIVAARITRKLPAVQDFGTRRLHIELSMHNSCWGAAFVAYWRCQSRHKRMGKARLCRATILHRISSCTKSFMQRGTCPIILPSAVAMRRTATRLKSSTLTATSTQNVEKTENSFPLGVGQSDSPCLGPRRRER